MKLMFNTQAKVVAIFAASLVLSNCGEKGVGLGHSVAMEKPEVTKSEEIITALAEIIPSEEATVRLPESSVIQSILVKTGDSVSKGDPLIQLDDKIIRSELRLSKAELVEAQTTSEKLLFERDNLELVNISKTEPKIEPPTDSKTEPKAERKEPSTNQLDKKSEYIKKQSEENNAKLESLKNKIAHLENQLSTLTLTSPIDGVVSQRIENPIGQVPANTTILRIINTNPVIANFELPADETANIQTGQQISLNIEGLGDEPVTGTANFVGPSLHLPENSFSVQAEISNPLGEIKIGMRGTVNFPSARQHDVHVIPTSAIVMIRNRPNVYIVVDSIAHLKQVSVKRIDSTNAIISGGLDKDDWVVISGQEDLQDGMIVDMR